jgi:excisionase family DNA binding protein
LSKGNEELVTEHSLAFGLPAAQDGASPGNTKRWLSVGEARKLLGVAPDTLRRWADSGHIRSFRTPGGHRRFAPEDVGALLTGQDPAPADGEVTRQALQRVRRRLRHTPEPQTWYQGLNEAARNRLRLMGRRLLEATLDYCTRRDRRPHLLKEMLLLGEAYGQELATGSRLGFSSMIDAFVFQQRSVADSIQATLSRSSSREEVLEAGPEIARVGTEVLRAMVRAWEEAKATNPGSDGR